MNVPTSMVMAARAVLPPTHETKIREALEAALRDYELALELSESEEALVAHAEDQKFLSGVLYQMCELVRRAQRVLVPKPHCVLNDVPVQITGHGTDDFRITVGDVEYVPKRVEQPAGEWTFDDKKAAWAAVAELWRAGNSDPEEISCAVLDALKHRLAPAAPVQASEYSEEQVNAALEIMFPSDGLMVNPPARHRMRAALAAASVPAQTSEDALHSSYLQGAESVRNVELANANEHQKRLMNRNAELLYKIAALEAQLAKLSDAGQSAEEWLSKYEQETWKVEALTADVKRLEAQLAARPEPVPPAFHARDGEVWEAHSTGWRRLDLAKYAAVSAAVARPEPEPLLTFAEARAADTAKPHINFSEEDLETAQFVRHVSQVTGARRLALYRDGDQLRPDPPFGLDASEDRAYRKIRGQAEANERNRDLSYPMVELTRALVLCDALDRAVRTLAAPTKTYEQGRKNAWADFVRAADSHGVAIDESDQTLWVYTTPKDEPDPLGDSFRAAATALVDGPTKYPAWITSVAAELLRRCPKPEPKQRTAQELADHIMSCGHPIDCEQAESLEELVARAERGEAK